MSGIFINASMGDCADMKEEPDSHDLNDWALFAWPEFHRAIQYLHETSRYDAMLELWEKKGKPSLKVVIS